VQTISTRLHHTLCALCILRSTQSRLHVCVLEYSLLKFVGEQLILHSPHCCSLPAMLPGWGDQQHLTEQPPPDSHTFNFPHFDDYQHDYHTASSQLDQLSWPSQPDLSQSHSHYHHDATTLQAQAGPSSYPDQSLWALHQPYHYTPQDHHDNDLGIAITVPIHHPQPSGHPLQDQLIHPRPQRFSDLVPPAFLNAWQQSPPISAASAAASDAMLNPSFFHNSEPMSAVPSPTHPSDHVFDEVVQHSIITRSHNRPKESSGATRSSRRSTRLTKAKSTATVTASSSAPSMGLKVVPYGIQEFLGECKEAMRASAFKRSLLPSPDSLSHMVKSSWDVVAKSQTDGKVSDTSSHHRCGTDWEQECFSTGHRIS
jgi:hypothetical protein